MQLALLYLTLTAIRVLGSPRNSPSLLLMPTMFVLTHRRKAPCCVVPVTHRFPDRYEMCSSRHAVTYNPDGVKSMRRWKFDYEIHSNGLPWLIRYVERL